MLKPLGYGFNVFYFYFISIIHFIANIHLEHSWNIFSSQLHNSSSSKLCNCSWSKKHQCCASKRAWCLLYREPRTVTCDGYVLQQSKSNNVQMFDHTLPAFIFQQSSITHKPIQHPQTDEGVAQDIPQTFVQVNTLTNNWEAQKHFLNTKRANICLLNLYS